MDTSVLERNSVIAALRARRQRKAVRRGMHSSVLLAGLLLCSHVSCSGGTVLSRVIPASDNTLAYPSWTLQFVDSQELIGSDGRGVNGFDGNTGTIWHTQYLNGAPTPPHEIQIQLGGPATLNGFVYVPRQDGSRVAKRGRLAR